MKIVIEKVDGKWPQWAIDKLRFDVAALAECEPEEILDALSAGPIEEPVKRPLPTADEVFGILKDDWVATL